MLRCPADRRTSLNRALPSDTKSCLGYSVQPSKSKLSVSQTSEAAISNSRHCHRQRPSHPAVCPTESVHTTPPGAPGCWSQVLGFCLQQARTCTQLPDCPEVRRIRVNPVSATPESLAVGYTREHARCEVAPVGCGVRASHAGAGRAGTVPGGGAQSSSVHAWRGRRDEAWTPKHRGTG